MWFRLGSNGFIGKKVLKSNGCDLFVSDFVDIWHKTLSDNELLSTSQMMNPLFEAPIEKIKEITLNLFIKDEKIKKEIIKDNYNLILKLEANRMGIKFQFKVTLEKGSNNLLYNEFTLPLLSLVVKMQNRENKLVKMIKEKDAEIIEYNQNYAIVKTSYSGTKIFSEKDLDESNSELTSNIAQDPSIFLDLIDIKLLFFEEQGSKIEEERVLENSKKKEADDKSLCSQTDSVFKNKNVCRNKNSEPFVKISHPVIKRRKKQSESFKIKF